MQNVNLLWTKDHKYYRLTVVKNLFGGNDVVCIWGSVGTNLGNYKIIPYKDSEQLQEIIDSVAKRRKSHKYQQVEG